MSFICQFDGKDSVFSSFAVSLTRQCGKIFYSLMASLSTPTICGKNILYQKFFYPSNQISVGCIEKQSYVESFPSLPYSTQLSPLLFSPTIVASRERQHVRLKP